jgi:uncharacterized LabA/DUF88 family protein
MRVYVYVDGFNLYYRALRGTAFKWINLCELARRVLDPTDGVEKVRYFTARVSARSGDPDAPRRQQIFFNALKTVPNIEFHYGRFLPKTKRRPLVGSGRFVEVHDTEEKGSDVNLATHLINDGWHKRYDVALVFSQDTDLIEPIRIVVQELRLKVGIVWLDGRLPNRHLAAAASFVRHIRPADLAASQFPNPVVMPDGKEIHKPAGW